MTVGAEVMMMLMTLLVAVSVLHVTSSEVCGVCNCERDGFHYDITCNCDKERELDLSKEFMKLEDDPRLQPGADKFTPLSINLSVSDCRTVTFRQGLNLLATRVDLRDVESLTVEPDAILVADELEVRRVARLDLSEGAFFTHNIKALLLEDVFVETVKGYSLASVAELQRVEMTRVTFQEVESQAIVLNKPQMEHILLSGVMIVRIKADGLILKANNVTMENCSFLVMEDLGVDLSSRSLIRVTRNTFTSLEGPRSLCISGGEVHVTANSFESAFPTCLMQSDIDEFVDNEFQFPISRVPQDTLANITEKNYRNSFVCECTDAFGSSLSSLSEAGHGPLLQKALCVSARCPRSISHDQLLREFRGKWDHCALKDDPCPSPASSPHSPPPYFQLWLFPLIYVFLI